MGLAFHCGQAVAEVIKRGKVERETKAYEGQGINWNEVVDKGCHGDPLCETTLIGDVQLVIAEELENMVEEGDEEGQGENYELDPRTLPNLMCAPDSITRACPKKLYREPDHSMDAMRPFSVALWNGRTVDANRSSRVLSSADAKRSHARGPQSKSSR